MDRDEAERFANHCVAELLFLEERLGRETGYLILEPFPVDAQDPVSVQSAAKRIADHIGVASSLVLIVAFASQERGVGGHVEMTLGDKEVFISISPSLKTSPPAVLAALAHEVTHVKLIRSGVLKGSGPVYEKANEELTDIAAVFLGLGKILLNGYAATSQTLQGGLSGPAVLTTRITQGYLGLDQLACTYRLVCAMRRIPEQGMQQGLSNDALEAIRRLDQLRDRFFSPDLGQEGRQDVLLSKAQHHLDDLAARVRSAEEEVEAFSREVMDPVRRAIEQARAELRTGRDFLQRSRDRFSTDLRYDPCWRFLANLYLRNELDHQMLRIERGIAQIPSVRALSKRFRGAADRPSSVPVGQGRRYCFLTRLLSNIRLPRNR